MFDTLTKIYLYFLIFSSLFFLIVQGGFWLAQRQDPRHPLLKRNRVWRNLFFLASGIVAWYLFYFRFLNGRLLMLCALLMVIVSVLLAELLGKESNEESTAIK